MRAKNSPNNLHQWEAIGYLKGTQKDDPAGPNLSDPDTGTGWTNYILTPSGMAFSKDLIYAFHPVCDQNGGAGVLGVAGARVRSARRPG